LATPGNPTESRARAKADILLLEINQACGDVPKPEMTMTQLIDRFIVDERLEEIKADESGGSSAIELKYSTAGTRRSLS
jgi:hypothetical protein